MASRQRDTGRRFVKVDFAGGVREGVVSSRCMQFLAVVNPAAGGGRCGKQFPAAIARLEEAGLEVDVAETSAPGDAIEIVKKAWASGRRHFIAVGGDGTGYELVNGMFPAALDGADEAPYLGFLPLGTGNSFLRDFSEDGASHALGALLERRTRSVDVIRVRHTEGELFYINLFAIGFAADVNSRAARYKGWGEFGYVGSVIAETLGLAPQPFPNRQDGGPWDREPAAFLSICNSRFTGGKMMMAPHADTGDGLVDVIKVGKLGRFGLLKAFPKLFEGSHVDLDFVTETQVAKIEFELEGPTDIMLDGEPLHIQPQTLEVLPGALKVFA